MQLTFCSVIKLCPVIAVDVLFSDDALRCAELQWPIERRIRLERSGSARKQRLALWEPL